MLSNVLLLFSYVVKIWEIISYSKPGYDLFKWNKLRIITHKLLV